MRRRRARTASEIVLRAACDLVGAVIDHVARDAAAAILARPARTPTPRAPRARRGTVELIDRDGSVLAQWPSK
jgi:hypothetical protein